MSIRWITEYLGTAAWSNELKLEGICIVDVRVLCDAAGNSPSLIQEKIAEARTHIHQGKRVIICCDYGISRSNAIAAAVLAQEKTISLSESLQYVISATGETEIKIDFVEDIRNSLGMNLRQDIGRKILVLGSDGFIGSYIHNVINQNQSQVIYNQQDLIENPVLLDAKISEIGSNRVIFCWPTHQLNTNFAVGKLISSLRNVLEVCRIRNISLTFLSGHQVFSGKIGSGEILCKESDSLSPESAVGDALFLAETLIRQYGQRDKISFLIIRHSYIYGCGDKRTWLLNTFLRQALADDEIKVHTFNNKSPTLGLTHVINLANMVKLATEYDMDGVLHIPSDHTITTLNLALYVVKLASSSSKVITEKMPGNYSSIQLESVMADKMSELASKIDFDSGFLQFVKNTISENL